MACIARSKPAVPKMIQSKAMICLSSSAFENIDRMRARVRWREKAPGAQKPGLSQTNGCTIVI
jgi:hypothetical protein